jgi:hypothetical protein
MARQPAGRTSCALPVVVVSSVYVPLALAVHVPLTLREPEIVRFTQLRGSRPASETSTFPLNFRQDELTLHVPNTLPPHGVPPGHDPPAPPLPDEPPPVPTAAPPPVPPVPDGVSEPPEHAPEIIPNAIAMARPAGRIFIEPLPSPMGTYISR